MDRGRSRSQNSDAGGVAALHCCDRVAWTCRKPHDLSLPAADRIRRNRGSGSALPCRSRRNAWRVALVALGILGFGPRDAGAKYLLTTTGLGNQDTQFRKGCHQVSQGATSLNYASTTACDGGTCPTCFVLYTVVAAATLTFLNCHTNHWATAYALNANNIFTFYNSGFKMATIYDGERTYVVNPRGTRGSFITCTCNSESGSGRLTCDAPQMSVTNVRAHGSSLKCKDDCVQIAATTTIGGTACSSPSFCSIGETDCNGFTCPPCFHFDSTSAAMYVKLTACSTIYNLDMSSGFSVVYTFSNEGSNKVSFGDATNTYTLYPKGSGASYSTCTCSNDLLSCSAMTVNGVSLVDADSRVSGKLAIGADTDTYFRYNSGIEAYVKVGGSSTRTLSMGEGNSRLHGTWASDGTITSSDKRLKRDIEPLLSTLQRLRNGSLATASVGAAASSAAPEASAASKSSTDGSAGAESGTASAAHVGASSATQARPGGDSENARTAKPDAAGIAAEASEDADEEAMAWLLERLRPVSFVRRADELGGRRFGFLADDLQEVLPDMVREDGDAMRTKRVHMDDFHALLVAAAQRQQRTAREQRRQIEELQNRQEALERTVLDLSRRLDACSACSPSPPSAAAESAVAAV
eukprot:TRINITY_DN27774_c0_g2_i1.p1 TRINITY_DN27774_c0_g2~~TRINITY_DN27774_c0_g2_i1.p1  ORF type:complete len:669 (-),score=121.50 TRINITY_DN27774_c0_g2_i1:131-2044(-)